MSSKLTNKRLDELILEVIRGGRMGGANQPQRREKTTSVSNVPTKPPSQKYFVPEKKKVPFFELVTNSIKSLSDLDLQNKRKNFEQVDSYIEKFDQQGLNKQKEKLVALKDFYIKFLELEEESGMEKGETSPNTVFTKTKGDILKDNIQATQERVDSIKSKAPSTSEWKTYKNKGNWSDNNLKDIKTLPWIKKNDKKEPITGESLKFRPWVQAGLKAGIDWQHFKPNNQQSEVDKKKEKYDFFEKCRKVYSDLWTKHQKVLSTKIKSIDLKQKSGAFDLKKQSQSAGQIAGFDIYGTKNVFKTNFEKLGLDLDDQVFDKLQNILSNAFEDKKDFKAIRALSEDTSRQFNIDDLSALFANIDKPSDEVKIPNTDLNIDAAEIKLSLKKAYQAVMNDNEFEGKTKQAALNSIKDLRDSVDYFASKKTLRTKTGAVTGFDLGTAETSGTARTPKALASAFNNISSGTNAQEKFKDLEKFLNETNKLVLNKTGGLSGNLQERFSRFVALEILSKQIFRTEEATVKGNLFESFLAMFLGGSQTGSDRGGSDFKLPDGTAGSAKMISSFGFGQAKRNLRKDPKMLYVIALKSTETQSGLKRLAGEKDRIQVIDIHLYETIASNESGEWSYKAIPINSSGIEIIGDVDDNDAKFKLSPADLKASFVARLDFSFMFATEFEDISSDVMKGVAVEVEQAFSALVNLRNNITSWISEKDLIAANQVTQDQSQLNDAIENMKTGKNAAQFAVSENKNKSIKDLDKLIEQVILYKTLLK